MPADRLLLRLREIIEGVELDRREAAAQPLEQPTVLRQRVVTGEQALDVGHARKARRSSAVPSSRKRKIEGMERSPARVKPET